MKKKHLIIIIGQSIVIFLLVVYGFVQQTVAKAAQQEAEAQKEFALMAKEEAERQKKMAEVSAMEAQKQAKIALEVQKKLDGKK